MNDIWNINPPFTYIVIVIGGAQGSPNVWDKELEVQAYSLPQAADAVEKMIDDGELRYDSWIVSIEQKD